MINNDLLLKVMKNYTNENIAPVILCFLTNQDKYLMLKRSDKVLAYQDLWSCLASFLDETKTPEEKIKEEIKEELGILEENIASIRKKEIYTFEDSSSGRSWIRHLYLVAVTTQTIKLNWEHTAYRWCTQAEIETLETTPRLKEDLARSTACV